MARTTYYDESMRLQKQALWVMALLFACLALNAVALAQEGNSQTSEVMAKVQGTTITREDVEEAAAQELEQLESEALQFAVNQERQKHDILEKQLKTLLADKLFALESAQRGISPEELLEKEVETKVEAPAEEEVELFYAENAQRLQGSKTQLGPLIRQFLSEQKREESQQRFVDQLREKYAVVYHFPPLRLDVTWQGHPSTGAVDAPVTIVEFSDFECPYCLGLFGTLKTLKQDYGEKVRLVFRQFPLNRIHPHAQKAAEASLCAADQGKFWEMHDLMFEDQSSLKVADLEAKAKSLGVDSDVFENCLSSGKYAERVRQDVAEGTAVGVTGTPAMFINGRPLVGNVRYAQITKLVDEELKLLEVSASEER
ncbi:thioredoxin domain-containing protein [Acidobacteria bacterium AH-259-D05]|nr:thioredoxin domain-containing protein [Acidobacteria bacterium AH-259-D05]